MGGAVWPRVKQVIGLGGCALISVSLLCLLFFRAGLTPPAIAGSIADIFGWALVCVVGVNGANLAFGTLKWLLVLRALAPNGKVHPQFTDAMLTTTLGALLGQVIPVQLAVVLTRSLAGRFGVGWSASMNLGTTAYEQLFDAIVLFAAAIAGLLGLALPLDVFGWILLIVLSGAIGLFVAIRLPLLLAALARLLGRVPSAWLHEHVSRLASAVGRAGELRPSVVAQLIAFSVLRYLANLTRVGVVLIALNMSAYVVPAVIAFPLIMLITTLPITPGNLGIIEWTWSTVLVSAGAGMGAAALFAVIARIINVLALTIVFAILLVFRLLKVIPAYEVGGK
jgi:uncharacterized protein (TIRG00374 family)